MLTARDCRGIFSAQTSSTFKTSKQKILRLNTNFRRFKTVV